MRLRYHVTAGRPSDATIFRDLLADRLEGAHAMHPPIVVDKLTTAGPSAQGKHARSTHDAVLGSHCVVLLLPAGPSQWVEMGIALGNRRKVFVCSTVTPAPGGNVGHGLPRDARYCFASESEKPGEGHPSDVEAVVGTLDALADRVAAWWAEYSDALTRLPVSLEKVSLTMSGRGRTWEMGVAPVYAHTVQSRPLDDTENPAHRHLLLFDTAPDHDLDTNRAIGLEMFAFGPDIIKDGSVTWTEPAAPADPGRVTFGQEEGDTNG